jgi:hypothetical protein
MGIQVRWDNAEHNILLWEFNGRWTVDNIIAGIETSDRYLNQATERVDFIIDVSEGGLIPPQLLRFVRNHHHKPHPMEGKKVVIGADRYLRLFWRELARYVPRHWQIEFAETYEAARAIIEAERYPALRS